MQIQNTSLKQNIMRCIAENHADTMNKEIKHAVGVFGGGFLLPALGVLGTSSLNLGGFLVPVALVGAEVGLLIVDWLWK